MPDLMPHNRKILGNAYHGDNQPRNQLQSASQLFKQFSKLCSFNIDGTFFAIIFTIICIIITLYIVAFFALLDVRILKLNMTSGIPKSIQKVNIKYQNLTEQHKAWKVTSYPRNVDEVIEITSPVINRLFDNGVNETTLEGIGK